MKRLEAQLAQVRERAPTLAPQALQSGLFCPPSRCDTPIEIAPHVSRQPSTAWSSTYPDVGDVGTPASAKRKAVGDRVRQGEAKRPKSSVDRKADNRLNPHGRMKNAFHHCSKILDTLMRDHASKAYFNAPVDFVTLGIIWMHCIDVQSTSC